MGTTESSIVVKWADGAPTIGVEPETAFDEIIRDKFADMKETDHAVSICQSIYLWGEVRFGMAEEFVHNLLGLLDDRASAYDRLVRLMATGFAELKLTYAERGLECLTTRQNVEQLEQEDFKAIFIRFPQMRGVIDPTGKYNDKI